MPMNDPKFVDVDGVRTRYFEQGAGEPMVLVHGADFGSISADCAADWDLNFDGLARSFRVIAVDKLGQGHTDNPKRDRDYTMEATVEHVHRFLATLGIENAHLVGHSRGGYLVCRLTLLHPERVKTCIIVDSGTLAPGTGRNEIVHANPPRPLFSRESVRWVLEKYSYRPDCVTDRWLDALMETIELPKFAEAVEKMGAGGLRAAQFAPALQADKEDSLRRIAERGLQRPTLLVWAYDDPTATLAQGRALYDLLVRKERRTVMQILNQAGHFVYREHPEAFNEAVRGFVAAH